MLKSQRHVLLHLAWSLDNLKYTLRRRTARFVTEHLGHLPLSKWLEFGRMLHDCIIGRVKRGSPKQGLSHAILPARKPWVLIVAPVLVGPRGGDRG
jgi:hypothetical protein